MRPLLFSEILSATGGNAFNPTSRRLSIKSISIDTRHIRRGDLFVAIKGNNFDGHDFIRQAEKSGASVILASKVPNRVKIPIIKVTDTIRALGDIASYYRTKINAKVIAITGSNGKTTTKEMLYKILSAQGATIQSPKSYNNFIGVPLTMFMVNPAHKYVIFELGTNQKGEIPYLAKIVQPDIAVITNIGASHLAGLGSIAGVAKAKSALFNHVKPAGSIVFEYDNKWLKSYLKSDKYNVITFGFNRHAIIRADKIVSSNHGLEFLVNVQHKCILPVMGAWNAANALAALAAARALGINIRQAINALKGFHLPPMRMERAIIKGITFINDAYNANPISTASLLDEIKLIQSQGRKILVFGEMRELGRYSTKYHWEIADKIKDAGLDAVLLIGKETLNTARRLKENKFKGNVFSFKSAEEISDNLSRALKRGDMVILKGSRGIGLEKVLERVKSAIR